MVDGASSRALILTPWSVLQMVLLAVAHPSSRSASTVAPAGPDTCRHGCGEILRGTCGSRKRRDHWYSGAAQASTWGPVHADPSRHDVIQHDVLEPGACHAPLCANRICSTSRVGGGRVRLDHRSRLVGEPVCEID
eukprot:2986531-Pyramimonas_sp.AAC.1